MEKAASWFCTRPPCTASVRLFSMHQSSINNARRRREKNQGLNKCWKLFRRFLDDRKRKIMRKQEKLWTFSALKFMSICKPLRRASMPKMNLCGRPRVFIWRHHEKCEIVSEIIYFRSYTRYIFAVTNDDEVPHRWHNFIKWQLTFSADYQMEEWRSKREINGKWAILCKLGSIQMPDHLIIRWMFCSFVSLRVYKVWKLNNRNICIMLVQWKSFT